MGGGREQRRFQVPPLEDMVAMGMVGPDSANIWFRSHRLGPVTLRWWPENEKEETNSTTIDIGEGSSADNTGRAELPSDGDRLDPLTRYGYNVVYGDGRELGRGRF